MPQVRAAGNRGSPSGQDRQNKGLPAVGMLGNDRTH
jgi:hypothetical protein